MGSVGGGREAARRRARRKSHLRKRRQINRADSFSSSSAPEKGPPLWGSERPSQPSTCPQPALRLRRQRQQLARPPAPAPAKGCSVVLNAPFQDTRLGTGCCGRHDGSLGVVAPSGGRAGAAPSPQPRVDARRVWGAGRGWVPCLVPKHHQFCFFFFPSTSFFNENLPLKAEGLESILMLCTPPAQLGVLCPPAGLSHLLPAALRAAHGCSSPLRSSCARLLSLTTPPRARGRSPGAPPTICSNSWDALRVAEPRPRRVILVD